MLSTTALHPGHLLTIDLDPSIIIGKRQIFNIPKNGIERKNKTIVVQPASLKLTGNSEDLHSGH